MTKGLAKRFVSESGCCGTIKEIYCYSGEEKEGLIPCPFIQCNSCSAAYLAFKEFGSLSKRNEVRLKYCLEFLKNNNYKQEELEI